MLLPISNVRAYSGVSGPHPALVGREPTGEPEAEIWYGDHPGSPSLTDGRSRLPWTGRRWMPRSRPSASRRCRSS
jgi:hypothetical protein